MPRRCLLLLAPVLALVALPAAAQDTPYRPVHHTPILSLQWENDIFTGRGTDPGLVLGPLIHEFGWGPADYDRLAAGTIAGHILECGPQCTGGNFTDWRAVPDMAMIGYPLAEVREDGAGGEFVQATAAQVRALLDAGGRGLLDRVRSGRWRADS